MWNTIPLRLWTWPNAQTARPIRPFSPTSSAIRAIGGKWKLEILFALMNGAMRFGALRRSLKGITQHMLTTQLRELEQDDLVLRTQVAEKPLRVEYELTNAACALLPTFRELLSWSKLHGPARAAAGSKAPARKPLLS